MDDDENTKNLKGERVYGRDVIYSYMAILNDNKIFKEDYSNSGIQIYFENETDKIVSFGKVDMANDLSSCIIERNKGPHKSICCKCVKNSIFNNNSYTII